MVSVVGWWWGGGVVWVVEWPGGWWGGGVLVVGWGEVWWVVGEAFVCGLWWLRFGGWWGGGAVVPASSNPNLLLSQHAPFVVSEAMTHEFYMNW